MKGIKTTLENLILCVLLYIFEIEGVTITDSSYILRSPLMGLIIVRSQHSAGVIFDDSRRKVLVINTLACPLSKRSANSHEALIKPCII